MPHAISYHKINCVHFWPARTNLAPCSVAISGPVTGNRSANVALSYESVLHVADVPFPATGWTKCEIDFELPFSGHVHNFTDWIADGNGRRKTIDRVVAIQNLLIDHIKYEVPFHADIDNLRHFGPAEWPYVRIATTERIVFEYLNPSLRSDVSAMKLSLSYNSLKAGAQLPLSLRSILRSRDLAECGYPTESLLLAFAVLDSVVQSSLKMGMRNLGIQDSSVQMILRNTTQSRLATFLDPVMKLVFGKSLAEEDDRLMQDVVRINKLRNSAIHDGIEITRTQARDACQIVYDALDFLRQHADPGLQIPPRPTFLIF